jgi:hypothetical protein
MFSSRMLSREQIFSRVTMRKDPYSGNQKLKLDLDLAKRASSKGYRGQKALQTGSLERVLTLRVHVVLPITHHPWCMWGRFAVQRAKLGVVADG